MTIKRVKPDNKDGVQAVKDDTAEEHADDIRRELKKLNMQMHIMTDTHIKDTEVDNG